jgi:predicted  nucleic acid-binding Zn-ribbon protein
LTALHVFLSLSISLYANLHIFLQASGTICRQYDEKCRHLRNQESRGENQMSVDRTRAAVKDLYSRILVAIQRIDMVSKNIEDLRDKELQPQLEELIGRYWFSIQFLLNYIHAMIQ